MLIKMLMTLVVESGQAWTLVDSLLHLIEEGDDEDNDGRKVGHNPPEHFE